jgi:glycosyltransferase involved in cell wall biosynthesis
MGHGIPIVAYGVTAVPETVGDAGLLLADKSPLPFAAAVGRILNDDTLRRHLTAAGLARASGFSLPDSQRRFVSLVQDAIGAPAGSS